MNNITGEMRTYIRELLQELGYVGAMLRIKNKIELGFKLDKEELAMLGEIKEE